MLSISKDGRIINNGPIPGENLTSDSRNYPWHRPPEIVDVNEAIELMIKKITAPKASNAILTFLEMGLTVATLTSTLVTKGISSGKWTPDMAILISGPTARIIELMAKKAGIEFRMGIEEDNEIVTATFLKSARSVKVPSKTDISNIKEEVVGEVKSKGFAKPMDKETM